MPTLKNRAIWVTRPTHQASPWLEAIRARGGQAVSVPMIEIQPVVYEKPLPIADIAIFVSPNAVQHTPDCLCLAVGKATADCLKKLGITAIYPREENSEGLLALPELQSVQNKKILIFKGTKGRELLQKTLKERGAAVECIETYKRIPPKVSKQQISTLPDAILVTSVEILKNLYQLVPQSLATPLVVISERIQSVAKHLGFKTVLNTQSAEIEACILALCRWYHEQS